MLICVPDILYYYCMRISVFYCKNLFLMAALYSVELAYIVSACEPAELLLYKHKQFSIMVHIMVVMRVQWVRSTFAKT